MYNIWENVLDCISKTSRKLKIRPFFCVHIFYVTISKNDLICKIFLLCPKYFHLELHPHCTIQCDLELWERALNEVIMKKYYDKYSIFCRYMSSLSYRYMSSISCRYMSSISYRYMSSLSCRYMSSISCRYMSSLSCRYMSSLSCRYMSSLFCRYMSSLSCRHMSSLSCRYMYSLSCRYRSKGWWYQ